MGCHVAAKPAPLLFRCVEAFHTSVHLAAGPNRPNIISMKGRTPRVQVPNDWVLGILAVEIVVQILGKYMIIKHLDP